MTPCSSPSTANIPWREPDAAAGLGVALIPSLAAWAVPAELALCRLTDPALRRTVHLALPAAPLPAALKLRELLRDSVDRTVLR
ncbi:hypothetical protein [Streptomyces sp. NY05-11A]|uniref:hypothetical protein n=1 Tax=Streptomyces soliscabiei TaxID=588897 RepID=UPI0039F6A047